MDILKNGVANSSEVETLRPNPSKPEPPPIDGGKSTNARANDKVVNVDSFDTTTARNEEKETAKPQAELSRKNEKPFTRQGDEPAFVIQLAAFRSAKKAEEIASLLSAKHGSRLDDIKLQTMRLDTGANGVFFRVVSPPLPRAQAETACTNLRRAGQDCFLRKFTMPEG